MLDGDVDLHSFAPGKLHDPRILAFMRGISVKPDPGVGYFSGRAAGAHHRSPA